MVGVDEFEALVECFVWLEGLLVRESFDDFGGVDATRVLEPSEFGVYVGMGSEKNARLRACCFCLLLFIYSYFVCFIPQFC